jgi:hypothetical protein
MVINVKRQWRCERCGAQQKEAALTRSHSPQQKIAQIVGDKGWPDSFHIYCLCQHCHDIWSRLEKRILRGALVTMRLKHEEYLNQC